MKHPADNLYYVTFDMLNKTNACNGSLELLEQLRPGFYRGAKVPVTLELVHAVHKNTKCVVWVFDMLMYKRRIPAYLYNKAMRTYHFMPMRRLAEATSLMDLLLERAKKEQANG